MSKENKQKDSRVEIGKKFLKKLKSAPYNNKIAGKSFIKKASNKTVVKDSLLLKPGGKFYELFKDVEFNNALAGKTFIRKVSKKK